MKVMLMPLAMAAMFFQDRHSLTSIPKAAKSRQCQAIPST